MRSKIGRRGTVFLAVVVLVATAVAGGALAAFAARTTAATTKTYVKVTESNYKIVLSRASAPVGIVEFIVHNSSTTAHKFNIKGTSYAARGISGTIAPNTTKYLTLTLAKGSYTVYCPLHISLGMKKAFSVGTTTGTTTTHTTTTATTTHWA